MNGEDLEGRSYFIACSFTFFLPATKLIISLEKGREERPNDPNGKEDHHQRIERLLVKIPCMFTAKCDLKVALSKLSSSLVTLTVDKEQLGSMSKA